MAHYFDENPHVASLEKRIEFELFGQKINLITDNGVFSKNQIDGGSFAFLKVLIPLHLSGNILDLGCGYGAIGLSLALFEKEARITLADINTRALALCEKNAKLLNLESRVTILHSDIYQNIEGKYDSIVLNPPIRAGKSVTYQMYEGSYERLIDGGSLYVVIRKNQGAPSASRFIESIYGNATLLKKDKGYYIYKATK